MANPFITSAKKLIYRQGADITYVKVTQGTYNVEAGTTTNIESTSTVKAFPKQVKVTTYNYPNLVGKDVVEFLIVSEDLTATPNTTDKITYSGKTYQVETYVEVMARGELVIYKIMASKG